jgi:hypothetical protein
MRAGFRAASRGHYAGHANTVLLRQGPGEELLTVLEAAMR